MIVNKKLNISAIAPSKLKEADLSTEASQYVIDNYSKVISSVRAMGISEEKAFDLVHDVYISLLEAEADGAGFDSEYFRDNGKCITLEQFVYGRIKLYSRNDRYRTDIIESGKAVIEHNYFVSEPVVNSKGYVRDANGNIKMEKKICKSKETVKFIVGAASSTAVDSENNDSFQVAYSLAESANDIGDIVELYSLKEQLDYCIDICSMHNIQLLNILKNMDELSILLGDTRRKKSDDAFSKLTELANYHDNFGDAITSILHYSMIDRTALEDLLSTY